jgi:hypothetical protein
VASNIDSLYRALRRFETSCIDFTEYGTLPRRGRLLRVYYLTKYGAELPKPAGGSGGRLKRGDLVLFTTVGASYTTVAGLWRWRWAY